MVEIKRWEDRCLDGEYKNPFLAVKAELDELRAALAEREWIDVNEKMPEESMYVLVHCEGGNVASTFYCSDASFFDFPYGNKLSRKTHGKWSKHFKLAREYGYKITHWMPLPKPPIDQESKGE